MTVSFLMLLPQLLAAGVSTEQEIVAAVKSFTPGLTDAELNVTLGLIKAGAARHKALAQLDQQPNA